MEAAPPSYETATLINVWDLVSRHLPSNELCSASLVCSRWHNTFTPHIWGNPASHFGVENDAVYVALVRFKRTLQTARLFVRSLTHTLHLPPAHPELYNGPHADWLRDILERLPNLQSLIVRGLPFFDHSALLALRSMRSPRESHRSPPAGLVELPGSRASAFQPPLHAIPSFSLRLLDASRCSNVTADGLASALRRFDGLLYLDLSFTYPARDVAVLTTLREHFGLQVLKLRGIGLRDDGVQQLSSAIGRRVRSLDVRDNLITDRGVRILLDECFAHEAHSVDGGNVASTGQRSPAALLQYLGTEMLEIYQGEDFEGFLRNAFTGRFVSRLAIEDAPSGGITHLYIADNALTVEGISGLIHSGRLHVFDVGSTTVAKSSRYALPSEGVSTSEIRMPGYEKLTPALSKYGSASMTFLRIDHSVVTTEVHRSRPNETVPGRTELDDTALSYIPGGIVEIDSTPTRAETFELPTDAPKPRYELPGDAMFVISPAVSDIPQDLENRTSRVARRGSAFAPEVVVVPSDEPEHMTLLSSISLPEENTLNTGILDPIHPLSPNTVRGPSDLQQRPGSYASTTIGRNARIQAHTVDGHNLHPAMLPRIKTLILTNVPQSCADTDTADRIIRFIRNCAQESVLARKLARMDYSLPPGRMGHASALKHSADQIFALQRLVLELAPKCESRQHSKASSWKHQETKSMTEDRDTEALWTAADTDFSFFGDEECGLPTIEPGRSAFHAGANEKEVIIAQPDARTDRGSDKATNLPKVDTVSKISAYRKERKFAHQRHVSVGNLQAETEGYWDGVVQVVHPLIGQRADEELDNYGNKFTRNYLYR